YGTTFRPRLASNINCSSSEGSSSSARSGCTTSQQKPPTTAIAAATAKDVVHPYRCPIHGVSEAVSAPPICPPMFTREEKTPELRPAISTETDQNASVERYKEIAPPATTFPARSREQ